MNYLDIHLFSDHVSHECKVRNFVDELSLHVYSNSSITQAAYFTSVVMYKPATLSLWVVLMATSHLTYWRRVKR